MYSESSRVKKDKRGHLKIFKGVVINIRFLHYYRDCEKSLLTFVSLCDLISVMIKVKNLASP